MSAETTTTTLHAAISRASTTLILLAIIFIAGALRLVALADAPPGLNQDEAANAWNAWCLLNTGEDQAGVRWPIFYTRGLGAPTTTPFIYWMIPFQAALGLNIWSVRLPGAVLGIAAVALAYYVGARLFGRTTGLLAAGVLAIAPWHVSLTRWGHEVTLAPLATLLALAAMLWARLPIDGNDRRPDPWRALVAGLLIGALCYGYGAIRLFLPTFVIATVIVTLPAWRRILADHCGRASASLFIVGLGATLGPLACVQLTAGAEMSQRAAAYWIAPAGTPLASAAAEIGRRYLAHFGPDFLFQRGDLYPIHHAPGAGVVDWTMLPLLLIGLAAAIWSARRSAGARIALCGFVLYPVGDVLLHFWVYPDNVTRVESLHLLRSSPGLVMLGLLAAIGAAALLGGLREHFGRAPRRGAALLGVLLLVATAAADVRRLYLSLVARSHDAETQIAFHADLVRALHSLRTEIDAADAVFITASRINMPYIVTLVTLGYAPRQWRDDIKTSQPSTSGEWEEYTRVGKFRFIYDRAALDELRTLQQDNHPNNALFIVRPGEIKLGAPLKTFAGPDGETTLNAYRMTL